MINYPRVSIIMPNYNGLSYIGKRDITNVLLSFLSTNYPDFELIFVDNNSNDGTINFISKTFKIFLMSEKLKIIETGMMGYTSGCNQAFDMASGKYIVIVNNDDKPCDRVWLKKLILECEKNDKYVCFGKKVKWDSPKLIDSLGLSINKAGLVKQENICELSNKFKEKKEFFAYQTPVAIRKDIIHKMGGYLFDEDYVVLNTDIDLSWRLRLFGYHIINIPEVIVFHKRSATMKQLPIKYVAFQGRKNMLQTLLKNYELKNLIKWLPISLGLYFMSIFYYLTKRRIDQVEATIHAIFWNLINLKKIMRKRKYIQMCVRKTSDESILRLMRPFRFSEIIRSRKPWPK